MLRSFFCWQPLTIRGWACLALGILALQSIALPESDLLAYVIGGSLIGLCGLLLGSSLYFRVQLAKRITAEVFFDTREVIAGTPSPAGIVLQQSNIPVFFLLAVHRRFDEKGVASPVHIVRGHQPDESRRHLIDKVLFPHRGLWAISALRITLQDALGFTSLSWTIPLSAAIEVNAQIVQIAPLPILAASAQIGDQITHSQERSGDLFDIKSYDPSDGIKRILWKTFAKSGQLMVRRPEPAVIPEGEVAVFLLADRTHDHVAGAFLCYLSQLIQQDIAVLFGTDGVIEGTGPCRSSRAPIVRNPPEIGSAINTSVWSKDAGSGNGFSSFLGALAEMNRPVFEVLVFAPASEDSTSGNASWSNTVSSAARSYGINLTVALVGKSLAAASNTFKTQASWSARSALQAATIRLFRQEASKPDVVGFFSRAGANVILCEKANLHG